MLFSTGAACIGGSGLLARPHLLALPLIEVWTAGLLIAVEQRRVPWLLLPLMTLWANLHGSFLFGLALACAFALEAAIAAGVVRVAAYGAQMGPVPGLRRCCGLDYPAWVARARLPIELMSMKQLGLIGEWKSLDFQATPRRSKPR